MRFPHFHEANTLGAIREYRNWSRGDLAKAGGVAPSIITRAESKGNALYLDTALRIAHGSGLSLGVFDFPAMRWVEAERTPCEVTNPRRHIAAKIIEIREKAGLTKVELADRLGVPAGTVTRWDQGATEGDSAKSMSLETAWLFCQAMGLPLSVFDVE